jgi:hypothetical protein
VGGEVEGPAGGGAAGAARAGPEPLATGEDAPLATALVGPRVAGWRDVAPVVGFYAAHPGAVPRPAPLDRVLFGVAQVMHAARLIWREPALRRAALAPTLLTLLGCGLLAAIATSGQTGEPGEPRLPVFQAFLASFVALASMPPTLLQRMWLGVALEARRALGIAEGERAFDGVGFPRLMWRESVKALRQFLVVSIGIAPLLGVLRLLPFGKPEAAALAALWAFYWVIVDAFELPIEVVPGPRREGPAPWYVRGLLVTQTWPRWTWPVRVPARWLARFLARLTRPWHEEVEATERRPWEALGFALAVGVVLAIPGVGLFFRSVAIVGATALLAEGQADRSPGGPGLP